MSPTRRLVFLGLVLLASCQRHQHAFVVNHRDEPVQLVYRNETVYPPDNRQGPCDLKERKPLLVRGTDLDDIQWSEVVEVASEFDEARCEIRLTLPPKSSVSIGTNEFCSGATEYIGREGFRPRLNYLRIEGQGGVIELSGWEVARALTEYRGFISHGYCRYDLR